MLRIGLIFDLFADYPWSDDDPPDADAEYEPQATVDALAAAVEQLGHQPVPIGTAYDLLNVISAPPFNVAINITESAGGRNREGYAPTLLEMARIPFLGSDALTLSLSLDKAWTKDLVTAAGVATPDYRVYSSPNDIDETDLPGAFPLFVKPRYEGSAKGISMSSRVGDVDALRAEVCRIVRRYRQEAIVEPFIAGGEYTVAVIGNDPPEALPILPRAVEIETGIGLHALEHRGMPDGAYAYEIRGGVDDVLESELHRTAIVAYEKLECRDFARVDFRVDERGQPLFLEINPLPTFAPDGTFAIIAELLNRNYEDLLSEVIERGLRRLQLIDA